MKALTAGEAEVQTCSRDSCCFNLYLKARNRSSMWTAHFLALNTWPGSIPLKERQASIHLLESICPSMAERRRRRAGVVVHLDTMMTGCLVIYMQNSPVCFQVEAYAALGKHREADTALQAAVRKDPSFRETKEYKSLNTQLSAYVQKGSRR